MTTSEPTRRAQDWIAALGSALEAGDADRAAGLFGEESYWRDLLSFTWTITTVDGRAGIRDMLSDTLARTAPSRWRVEGEASESDGVTEAWLTFETKVARCRGLVRLRDGKGWTLFTAMSELKGHEEHSGRRRDIGTGHGVSRDAPTWKEVRETEEAELGRSVQPYCVIVGGGQGGIALGARLRRLGVPTIIVETNPRPGDSWRNRYRSLVLHDPVWYDHLPYLPFPDDWPIFTPKDKLGDWLEAYVRIMELTYWGSTTCTGAAYDEASGTWTVNVDRAGEKLVLRPRQLVLATGAYGYPVRVKLPGDESFAGDILHSADYQTGECWRGKKAIVLGANTSAHDMAADLWRHGADVTMIQRTPTTVVKWETMLDLGFKSLYSEEALERGITTDKADDLFASTPYAVMPVQQRALYRQIAERDKDFYAALARTGFQLDWGEDESGLMMKALRRAAGYYIEVGASDLIIKGEIKVRSGTEIGEVRPRSIFLTDGSELPADVIVLATGYGSMHEMASRLISPEVGERVGPCWGLGSGTRGDPGPWQGELRNMWKPVRQKALWFHGGNLHLSRYYSRFVALQIKARQVGIPTPVYRDPLAT